MRYLILVVSIFLLIGCAAKHPPEDFKYDIGEVVYYKIDNIPMLIDKRIYKKGQKKYKVVFKNEEGLLLYNIVLEHEILSAPPFDRMRL
jgi:hypothetical protein